ncbi:AAA family ATPase [Mycolicibacterium mageritense]|uniref:AAA family ATPase n=1 Tax=Mycolicibacterium mageritense TaxID=53462 RepID=UPI001E58B72F|nr:hypothetical protein [Mycolicibacterium mageritense]
MTGPPCAGKTTWVRENADPRDVVIDMDALVAALHTGDASHEAPSTLVWRVAMAARDAAVRKVFSRDGRSVIERAAGAIDVELDAYVIHAVPGRDQVRRYLDQGARILVVDPGRATVVARAEAAGRIAAVHNTIAAWYQDASYVADRGCRVA